MQRSNSCPDVVSAGVQEERHSRRYEVMLTTEFLLAREHAARLESETTRLRNIIATKEDALRTIIQKEEEQQEQLSQKRTLTPDSKVPPRETRGIAKTRIRMVFFSTLCLLLIFYAFSQQSQGDQESVWHPRKGETSGLDDLSETMETPFASSMLSSPPPSSSISTTTTTVANMAKNALSVCVATVWTLANRGLLTANGIGTGLNIGAGDRFV